MSKLTYCALAVGPRASSILDGLARRASSTGLAAGKVSVEPNARAEELLEAMGAVISGLPGCDEAVLLVDGYSDRSVRAARLLLEMWDPRPSTIVFMIPPFPNEKRLERLFRFNVGLMANSPEVDGALVDVESPDGDGEMIDRISAVLSDFLRRRWSPPLSEFLEDGGNYVLVVGGFGGAKEAALASALEEAPSVVVDPSPSAELVAAAALASALGTGVDAIPSAVDGINYVIMRRDLRHEDPIYSALSGRGPVPTLDLGPTLPARFDLPFDFYAL